MRVLHCVAAGLCWLTLSSHAWAGDIVWTRPTGLYPVESAPVVGVYQGDPAIYALNRGGEILIWREDGATPAPEGKEAVGQFPKGDWSSSPLILSDGSVVACTTEGLVAALDASLQPIWRCSLPGKTSFACATPVLLPSKEAGKDLIALSDQSGTLTTIDLQGNTQWQCKLGAGECDALLQVMEADGAFSLLASEGPRLHRVDASGKILWSRELAANVSARAEILSLGSKSIVAVGTADGGLYALNPEDGAVLWTAAIGDEVGNTITLLPRPGEAPLILCTGLWGNLHAFDTEGHSVWTYLFRSKNRGRLVLIDSDGDGHKEIALNTYGQYAYLIDDQGRLKDAVRLNGSLSTSPILLEGGDILTVDASLLAHRIHLGTPKSPYGDTPPPASVAMAWPKKVMAGESSILVIDNPEGALLRIHLSWRSAAAVRMGTGLISVRSRMALALPEDTPGVRYECRIEDAQGAVVREGSWELPAMVSPDTAALPALRAWPTPAYGLFDEARRVPCVQEEASEVTIDTVYTGEKAHGGFIIASDLKEPCRVHLNVTPLKGAKGEAFGGKIDLEEVVVVGTVNGEKVADALADLGSARLTTIPSGQSRKYWLSVRAEGAAPGVYTGKILVEPLFHEAPVIEVPVRLEVLPLALTDPMPLRLCTWDYIPNNWFPERTAEVLDGMRRQGVSIFPRTTATPQGKVDEAGALTMDWTKSDADMAHFIPGDFLLLQLTEPPISFAVTPSPEARHAAQLAYMRQWRDHLREMGWNYDHYAFYPVDEPGLNYGGNNVQLFIDSARFFREADPKFKIYTDPVPGLSWTDYQRIAPLVDVWCPCMRLLTGALCDDPRTKDILASGKLLFSYECISQVRSLSPLLYNRSNPWRADYFGLDGLGFWTFSTTEINHWFPGKTVNDEYALVYPGPLPVSSVRWEAVRDGLEDIAAVHRLTEAMGDPAVSTEWKEKAQKVWRIARNDAMEGSDGTFIESRDFLRAGDRRIPHTWTDVEVFEKNRKAIAEVTLAIVQH